MKLTRRSAVTAATVAGALALITTNVAAAAPHGPSSGADQRPTVVLVHGAWADGSSWSAVTERLQHEGYTVDVPPNTLRGVGTDSANLRAFLSKIKGPIVLVGHSYGGMVISNAATGNPNVKSLVYVDAYIPDAGETVSQLTSAEPGSELNPSTSFNAVPIPNGGGNVDLYVKQGLFPKLFAGGIDPNKAAVLAATQRPLAASALDEPSSAPAWKTIPSWAVIGSDDKVIPPAELKNMAERAHSRSLTIRAPHLSMVAKPDAVTHVITEAARHS